MKGKATLAVIAFAFSATLTFSKPQNDESKPLCVMVEMEDAQAFMSTSTVELLQGDMVLVCGEDVR